MSLDKNSNFKNDLRHKINVLVGHLLDLHGQHPTPAIQEALRSAATIGSAFLAATATKDKEGYAVRLQRVLEAADQTKYWLSYLDSEEVEPKMISQLTESINEIGGIFGKTIKTIRSQAVAVKV